VSRLTEGRGGPGSAWGVKQGQDFEQAKAEIERGTPLQVPTAKRFRCVPSMFDSLGVQVPYTT